MSNSTLFLNSITYEKWILNLLLVELKFIIYNNDNVLIFINWEINTKNNRWHNNDNIIHDWIW